MIRAKDSNVCKLKIGDLIEVYSGVKNTSGKAKVVGLDDEINTNSNGLQRKIILYELQNKSRWFLIPDYSFKLLTLNDIVSIPTILEQKEKIDFKVNDRCVVTKRECCRGHSVGTLVLITRIYEGKIFCVDATGTTYYQCRGCLEWTGVSNIFLKTQKAKGIAYIKTVHVGTHVIRTIPHRFIILENDLSLTKPVFARPCPIRPRHGFVESRVCNTTEELKNMWNEVKKIDPEAELALGPVVNVTHSAVLAGGCLFAVGPGNAGATGGKDSISIPIIKEDFKLDKKECGIKEDEDIYHEYIYVPTLGGSCCVQLRGGPKVTTTGPDFIPIETVVKNIITPTDDLLAWEKIIEDAPIGTVAYAPGGSLASHAAVHCICKNVPYVTSKKPEIGETFNPTEEKQTQLIYKEFRRGLGVAWSLKTVDEFRKYLLPTICLFHQYSAWRSTPISSYLLGIVAGVMFRAAQMFVSGEHRHCNNPLSLGRENMWINALNLPQNNLTSIESDFRNKIWGKSVGGQKWANITRLAIKVFNKFEHPEQNKLVIVLNRLLNAVHNNAPLFTKIISSPDLNAAALTPTKLIVAIGYNVYDLLNKQPTDDLPSFNKIAFSKRIALKIDSLMLHVTKELLYFKYTIENKQYEIGILKRNHSSMFKELEIFSNSYVFLNKINNSTWEFKNLAFRFDARRKDVKIWKIEQSLVEGK